MSKQLYFPYKEESDSFVLSNELEKGEVCEYGLPVPPKDLWLGYGQTSPEYLYGKNQVERMLNILGESKFKLGASPKILDFGCGAGRMVRWFKPSSERGEIWGCDISSEHILWAHQYLSPPFHFFTNTVVPHLPFESNYFDLIYAGSVFTHIDDLAMAWLLEMRRILKPEGRLYITIQEKHSMKVLAENKTYEKSWLKQYLSGNPLFNSTKDAYNMIVGMRGPKSQVFYDIDFFLKSISCFLIPLSVNREAYGFQTALALKKM